MDKYEIIFQPKKRITFVSDGETILSAAIRAGIYIPASCGGEGQCGKCKVLIRQGKFEDGVSPKLTREEIEKGYRLACQTRIKGKMEIEIPLPEEELVFMAERKEVAYGVKISEEDLEKLVKGWAHEPITQKIFLKLSPPTAEDNESDLERLLSALANKKIVPLMVDFFPIKSLATIMREKDWGVTVTLADAPFGSSLVSIEAGDTTRRHFSLAIDIGTTTVKGQLIDLNQGVVIAEYSEYNQQISYGEDIISRIVYSQKGKGLQELQKKVVASINNIVDQLLRKGDVKREEISYIIAAGNTTMTHLLMGIDPKYLRESPYVPTCDFFPMVRAARLGINVGSHVYLYSIPNVASFIGGDITAGVLGVGLFQRSDLTLYIDIGTNGEAVLGNRDWMVATSCSAGPCFEGGGMRNGMRAVKGAIEDVVINPRTYEPMIITIGQRKPKGICGSGLINTVAEMLEVGILNQQGKINQDLPTKRIRQAEYGVEYILVWAEDSATKEDIVINEVDMDNLIRAKGAVYAGIKVLLKSLNLNFDDVHQIMLAGNFGNYLNAEKAMTIGLLPPLPQEKIIFVGNGALLGARLVAFSRGMMRRAANVAKMMTNVELVDNKLFYEEYMAALFLPHTNENEFPQIYEKLKKLKTRV